MSTWSGKRWEIFGGCKPMGRAKIVAALKEDE